MDANWLRCLQLYLQSVLDRSGSVKSLATARSTLDRFFSDPDKSPADYTRVDVLEFLQQSSTSPRNYGQQVGPATKNQKMGVLTSFYRFASEYEVKGKPLFDKALPTRGMHSFQRDISYHAMSSAELERFFLAIPDTLKGCRDRALFLTYFWTTRRRSEIARLRWRDIEPAIIVDKDGSRRAGYLYRFTPKGHSRQVHTAELPLPAWNAIKTYLERSGRLARMRPNTPIFMALKPGTGRPNHARNEPLHGDYINRVFKDYARAAGLDATRLSLHSLRHTAASLRHQAGQNILEIKEVLGHERLETTYNYLQRMSGTSDSGVKLLEARYPHLAGLR